MSTPAGVEDRSADLLFEFPQQGRADLVFGDSQHSASSVEITVQVRLPGLAAQVVFIPPSELTFVGPLPGLSGHVIVRLAQPVAVAAVLPGLTVSAQAQYESNTSRPTVAVQNSPWEQCQRSELGSSQPQQSAGRSVRGWEAYGSAATTLPQGVFHPLPPVQRALHRGQSDLFERGGACDRVVGFTHDQGMSTTQLIDAHFGSSQALRRGVGLLYQEATRIRSRNPRSVWQNALPLGVQHPSTMDKATALWRYWASLYQEAMQPPPGISRLVLPEQPPPSPCYTPSAHLLFAVLAAPGTALLFACDKATNPPPPDGNTVRVPVQRVYFVINNVTLHRLPDGIPVPVFNLSLSLDTASWTWGFDAQLPAKAEALLAPGSVSGPVELVASINGTDFRVLAESISRERRFGEASIRVSGRGRNAVLAAPYAPVMTFSNTEARTARQLMDDVLTVNGIPLGWNIDWGLTDWNVPAGVFAQQGIWIEALASIASAAGGYLSPHPFDPTIRVRHRYPVAPWEWSTVIPDFVLPVDAVARESLRWVEKPGYNRVFVSGQDVGVLGQVTRAGTAGDVLAPMVVDALITEAAAARQRGIAVLADTGQQIEVSLRLPVLAETGIIEPGAFVEYQDGRVTRLGLVRSTQVEAGMPEVWQTLGVQSHA
jgi:hypothetical protein